ncbi:MAG TPA: hypothetical protein ENK50_01815 [Sedimenticola sp.]|nr:hypothetical protein [Sedimenticola sp.]
MNVYATDKLIGQARQLAAEYRRAMGKPLPGISNEIALHDAMRLLALEPAPEGSGGFDATDPARSGKRLQIKSRTLFDEGKGGQRIGQIRVEQPWDAVLLVLMDADYEPYEIYEAEREELLAFIKASSSSRARRGALSVARFKIIGRLVWTREEGLVPELWSNQGG